MTRRVQWSQDMDKITYCRPGDVMKIASHRDKSSRYVRVFVHPRSTCELSELKLTEMYSGPSCPNVMVLAIVHSTNDGDERIDALVLLQGTTFVGWIELDPDSDPTLCPVCPS